MFGEGGKGAPSYQTRPHALQRPSIPGRLNPDGTGSQASNTTPPPPLPRASPPLQLKSLLDTEFRTINDFRSKAAQYKPHNTASGAGDAKAGRKGVANGVAAAGVPAA